MKNKMRMLGIEAHPDDCDWMMSGLTMKFIRLKHEVVFVCLYKCSNKEKKFAERSAELLGVKVVFLDIEYYNVPNHQYNSISRLNEVLKEYNPDIAVIPFVGDYHPQHRSCGKASYEAIQKFQCKEVYAYEFPNLHNWHADFYIDITDEIEKITKNLEVFKQFERETLSENTLIRTKKGMSMVNGASANTPVMFAEAYKFVKYNKNDTTILPVLLGKDFKINNPQNICYR